MSRATNVRQQVSEAALTLSYFSLYTPASIHLTRPCSHILVALKAHEVIQQYLVKLECAWEEEYEHEHEEEEEEAPALVLHAESYQELQARLPQALFSLLERVGLTCGYETDCVTVDSGNNLHVPCGAEAHTMPQ